MNKSPGIDGITNEAILTNGEIGFTWLTSIFQKAWMERKAPDDWQRAVIVPIWRKGSRAVTVPIWKKKGSEQS